MYFSVGAWKFFSSKKGEFDRCFNRLDRPVKESRPDRSVDLTRFPFVAGDNRVPNNRTLSAFESTGCSSRRKNLSLWRLLLIDSCANYNNKLYKISETQG